MRQTHASLGLGARLQQVFLVNAGCDRTSRARHPEQRSPGRQRRVPARDARPAQKASSSSIHSNLMMRYDTRLDPRGLRQDLKKLLELSHVG
jgi:hypothetical protein